MAVLAANALVCSVARSSMPSLSFQTWNTQRLPALDELEVAHRSVGGTGRGRRYATQQINQAYAVLLSSQFQGFCRDLHSECADHFVQSVPPGLVRATFRKVLEENRKLDKGNANPANIGADYNRFGISIWYNAKRHDVRNQGRRDRLDELNRWRNAIAHHDFDPIALGGSELRLRWVRNWRSACEQVAISFDEILRNYLKTVNGMSPS